jgi:hypothetical protein
MNAPCVLGEIEFQEDDPRGTNMKDKKEFRLEAHSDYLFRFPHFRIVIFGQTKLVSV